MCVVGGLGSLGDLPLHLPFQDFLEEFARS